MIRDVARPPQREYGQHESRIPLKQPILFEHVTCLEVYGGAEGGSRKRLDLHVGLVVYARLEDEGLVLVVHVDDSGPVGRTPAEVVFRYE